jgi:hypothetical protein
MNHNYEKPSNDDLGLGRLSDLPSVPAEEFADWDRPESLGESADAKAAPQRTSLPFPCEQAYRFCKAVVDHPLRPSSEYAKRAGISSKTAVPIRRELVARKFIREHPIAKGGRNGTAICLETLPLGRQAVVEYESQERRRKTS